MHETVAHCGALWRHIDLDQAIEKNKPGKSNGAIENYSKTTANTNENQHEATWLQ